MPEVREPMGQRLDARRNRDHLLRTAEAALTDPTGAVPSLEEIARRAGLGRSTLYRNFPDRHELARAVIAKKADELRAAVADVTAGRRTFRDVLTWMLETQLEMRPLVVLMRQLPPRAQQRVVRRLARVLTPAFEHARATGELRHDLSPADLPVILAMLDAAVTQAELGDAGVSSTAIIDVLLDGLFAATTPARPTGPGSAAE
jgi:AcrR family transcriptional regulator